MKAILIFLSIFPLYASDFDQDDQKAAPSEYEQFITDQEIANSKIDKEKARFSLCLSKMMEKSINSKNSNTVNIATEIFALMITKIKNKTNNYLDAYTDCKDKLKTILKKTPKKKRKDRSRPTLATVEKIFKTVMDKNKVDPEDKVYVKGLEQLGNIYTSLTSNI